MKEVIIIKWHGLIDIRELPEDVTLEIRDFDIEDYDYPENIEKDSSGNEYVKVKWKMEDGKLIGE